MRKLGSVCTHLSKAVNENWLQYNHLNKQRQTTSIDTLYVHIYMHKFTASDNDAYLHVTDRQMDCTMDQYAHIYSISSQTSINGRYIGNHEGSTITHTGGDHNDDVIG